MKPKRSRNEANSEQTCRFIETARELGCDESEEAFAEKLRKIGKAKPKKDGDEPDKK